MDMQVPNLNSSTVDSKVGPILIELKISSSTIWLNFIQAYSEQTLLFVTKLI